MKLLLFWHQFNPDAYDATLLNLGRIDEDRQYEVLQMLLRRATSMVEPPKTEKIPYRPINVAVAAALPLLFTLIVFLIRPDFVHSYLPLAVIVDIGSFLIILAVLDGDGSN